MKNLKYILAMAVVTFSLPAYSQLYLQHNVVQASQLVADAGPSLLFCPGDSLLLGGNPSATGGIGPYTYAWSPTTNLSGATTANPVAIPTATSTYQLVLTDANNCTSTGNQTATLFNVLASWNYAANLLVVSFTDASVNATGWAWDFGDGGTSVQPNPTHTYATPGTYTVCLTVEPGSNCESTTCDTINVVGVGVQSMMPGVDVQAYPNPTSGNQLNFKISGNALVEPVNIELMDLQGRSVLRYEGSASQAVHTLSRKALAAGSYQYRVSSGNMLIGTGKVVLR